MSNADQTMSDTDSQDFRVAPSDPLAASGDRLLAALDDVDASYRRARAEAERRVSELYQARGELDQSRRESEQERATADRHRQRADQLAAALKDIHRALFSGNVYELILKACLTLTGATRGLYIIALGDHQPLKIRAAIDVDGYPSSPPSEFLEAACRKAFAENDTYVCNSPNDRADLPEPTRPGEQFRNLVVAPSVLMNRVAGVVLAADKMGGDFDDEDVETLLSVGDQAAIAVENARLRRDLDRAYLTTITALADAVEAKDPYTHGHCERVARYAHRIAERLKMSDHEQGIVYYAALLHDVGKIGVSDGLLNKPGPLGPEERELVRSHVRVGHDLVRKVPVLSSVADAVLHHHEWYDGSGYPDGLEGEDIPLPARIVCVADAYGAMIDRRSYKEPYTTEQARSELVRCSGTQFDPQIVELFLTVLDQSGFEEPDEDADISYGLFPVFADIRETVETS